MFNEGTAVTGVSHKYISMSWRTSEGQGDQIEDREGLSTKACLGFILSIPENCKIGAYGFGYDLTKLLEDLPAELLYLLTHPTRREYRIKGGRFAHRPVFWKGFAIDLFNTRLKVGQARIKETHRGPHLQGYNYRVVHDLSKFYQAKFVTACKNWDVGTPKARDTMRGMKSDRRNLIKYSQEEILDYSNKECEWLAELAQKLDGACLDVGAQLRGQYFGAGSIAKALMRSWGIKEQIAKLPPVVAQTALFAFFGGRFELSRRGSIPGIIHDWDISAAYPYEIFRLPCLLCGQWSKTTDLDRVKTSQCALVRYTLRKWKGALPPWGPFPFRDIDGSIPFPVESGGGWLHKEEFLQGLSMWPNVNFVGAWIYESKCGHRPFEKIRDAYLERLRIGKEGAGIVLKLGTNAIAGSIMQTVGTRPYHCPIWAGLITSGTRCGLLKGLAAHEKWSDVLMMATDGMWSLKDTPMPKPEETGTDIEVIEDKTGKRIRKPLGGWEHDTFPNGVFMARPGIYFPLGMGELASVEENETDDVKLKDLKARGIGIRTLYLHRNPLMAHYEKTKGKEPYIIGDAEPLEVIKTRVAPQGVERFCGLKSGILRGINKEDGKEVYRKRSVYGLWTLQDRKVDFKALPKRNEGDGSILEVRRLPLRQISGQYDKMKSKVALDDALNGATEIGFFDDEQDDWAE